jgi:hypothetical protein
MGILRMPVIRRVPLASTDRCTARIHAFRSPSGIFSSNAYQKSLSESKEYRISSALLPLGNISGEYLLIFPMETNRKGRGRKIGHERASLLWAEGKEQGQIA